MAQIQICWVWIPTVKFHGKIDMLTEKMFCQNSLGQSGGAWEFTL